MAQAGGSETEPLLAAESARQSDSGADINAAVNSIQPAEDGKPVNDEESRANDDEPTQHEGMPEVKARLKYIVPAVGIGILLSAADQTLVVSCYGKIGSDLKALNKSSWISTVYFLTLTSFQPLYGKLSDIFGRKSSLLFAYTVFGIGCLFCGLARTMDELIVARAFAGVGGGGMTTVVSILMSDIVPLRERGTWQGLINIIYAFGAGAGAPLGGFLSDYVSWRFAFIFQTPLCAAAIVAVAFALKLPHKDVQDWKTKFRRVDFLGAFLLILAVLALLLGLDRGSNDSWSKPITIVSLCLSVPLIITFLFVEVKVSEEPLAPKRIVMEKSLAACYICNFFAFAAWMAVLFYLPLYFQAVEGWTASKAGLVLLPAIAASVTGSLSGGVIMQKTGKYYWLTGIAYALNILAFLTVALCAGIIVNSNTGIAIGLAVSGLGNGIGVTTTLIGLIANAAPEDIAIVTACSYLFRSAGSVIGLSLASTVVQQSLRVQLLSRLTGAGQVDQIVKNVRESLDYIHGLNPHMQKIVQGCYGQAIQHGLVFSISLAVCVSISSWFISEKSLNR